MHVKNRRQPKQGKKRRTRENNRIPHIPLQRGKGEGKGKKMGYPLRGRRGGGGASGGPSPCPVPPISLERKKKKEGRLLRGEKKERGQGNGYHSDHSLPFLGEKGEKGKDPQARNLT